MNIRTDLAEWLASFQWKNHRPLRVLHIGNIANNAFLNAKFMRSVGIDADVVTRDYYHVMATAEWEEAVIKGDWGDDNHPKYTSSVVGSYRRPRWFVQGTLAQTEAYLQARNNYEAAWRALARETVPDRDVQDPGNASGFSDSDAERAIAETIRDLKVNNGGVHSVENAGSDREAEAIPLSVHDAASCLSNLDDDRPIPEMIPERRVNNWNVTSVERAISDSGTEAANRPLAGRIARRVVRLILPDPDRRRLVRDFIYYSRGKKVESVENDLPVEKLESFEPDLPVEELASLEPSLPVVEFKSPEPIAEPAEYRLFKKFIDRFGEAFPLRPDRLTLEDLVPYSSMIGSLEAIFSRYDVVQAYGTDPILPMLVSKAPYVAFEHGTLRDFIRNDNATNRLTALAYRLADHVFVSNGDCLEHAHWLGCQNISPIIHPVDVEQHRVVDNKEVSRLRRHYDADVILLCPLRHDWATKGTDVHLRALPHIRRAVKGRVALVTTPWGAQINESRRLIEDLGCLDMVRWLDRPLSRLDMISHLHAADVVLDQIALPHFGATAPQALSAGRPVVMSYKPTSTAWIVSEPAPILAAFTPEEVCTAVLTALDPEWQRTFNRQVAEWIDEQHSVSRLLNDQLSVYRNLLGQES